MPPAVRVGGAGSPPGGVTSTHFRRRSAGPRCLRTPLRPGTILPPASPYPSSPPASGSVPNNLFHSLDEFRCLVNTTTTGKHETNRQKTVVPGAFDPRGSTGRKSRVVKQCQKRQRRGAHSRMDTCSPRPPFHIRRAHRAMCVPNLRAEQSLQLSSTRHPSQIFCTPTEFSIAANGCAFQFSRNSHCEVVFVNTSHVLARSTLGNPFAPLCFGLSLAPAGLGFRWGRASNSDCRWAWGGQDFLASRPQ